MNFSHYILRISPIIVCALASMCLPLAAQQPLKVDSLEKRLEENLSEREELATLWQLIEGYRRTNIDEAFRYVDRADGVAERIGDAGLIVRTLHYRIESLLNRGDYDRAAEVTTAALELTDGREDLRLERYLTYEYQLSQQSFREQWPPERVDTFLRDFLTVARQAGDRHAIGKALNKRANDFGTQHADSAFYYFFRARDVLAEAGEYEFLARIHRKLGFMYDYLGDGSRALDNYLTAYELYERLGIDSGVALIRRDMGMWYFEREDYREAERNFNLSGNAFAAIGSPGALSNVQKWLGRVYFEQERYEEAETAFQAVLEHREEVGRPDYLTDILMLLAETNLRRGRYTAAATQADRAATLIDEISSRADLKQRLELLMADLREARGQWAAVTGHLKSALRIASSDNDLSGQVKIARRLTENYLRRGLTTAATENYQLYTELADSLTRQERQSEEAKFESLYSLGTMEAQIQELEQDGQIAALKAERQRTYLVAAGIALLLLVILAYSLYRLFVNKRRGNRELAARNARIREMLVEKEMLVEEIHHRARNNLSIVESLLQLQTGEEGSAETRTALLKAESRLVAIRLIHQQLFRHHRADRVNTRDYLNALADNLRAAILPDNVSLLIGAADHTISIDAAVPLGLMANEAITNAIKYAFPPDRAGEILLEFGLKGADHFSLRVVDDGVGLPPGDQLGADSGNFYLIRGMVSQLHGELKVSSTGRGTEIAVVFPRRQTDPATVGGRVPTDVMNDR